MALSFVKVFYKDQNVRKFIKLAGTIAGDATVFSESDIPRSVLGSADLTGSDTFQITDQQGTVIPVENLSEILAQYACCACFELVVHTTSIPEDSVNFQSAPVVRCNAKLGSELEINSESLKSYEIADDGQNILKEYQENNTLKDSSRRVIVTLTVNFLRQVCGNYPRREEKEAAAKAIISLFPAFKIKDSSIGGHELFFNPINNQGYIATKLKNVNIKRHKLEGTYGSLKKKTVNCENYSNIQAPELDEDTLEFFRNSSIEQQENIIKAKLKETLIVRENIYRLKYLQIFPFFFFKPELTLYEYELRYSKTADGLLHNWVKYSKVVDEVLKETIGEPPLCLDGWSIQTKSFLTLLKLLPSTASRSKSKDTNRPSFEDSIKFQKTSPDKFVLCNTQPWIIAYGKNKTAISQYFLVIDGRLISLPFKCSFLDCFDYLFKFNNE